MIIVTGASQNHFKTLNQFIDSYEQYKTSHSKMVVYNLGISDGDWASVQKKYPSNEYRVFDFSKYPSQFQIEVNAGEYAWKPVILHEVCEQYGGVVVWMDSGDKFLGPPTCLDDFEREIVRCSIHTGTTSGDIQKWTHPKTLEFMQCPKNRYRLSNKNGACVGVNYEVAFVKDFVQQWSNLAQTKECIAPEGSSRANHRQDQAVLTVLYYEQQSKYKFPETKTCAWNNFVQYSIHNDID